MADLNGEPGSELIFVKSVPDSNEIIAESVRIISDRANICREYSFANFSTDFVLDLSMMTDLNGLPGNELALRRSFWDDNSFFNYEYAIICFRNDRVNYYLPGPNWNYYDLFDYDGQPGKEIVLTDYSDVKAICDARGMIIQ